MPFSSFRLGATFGKCFKRPPDERGIPRHSQVELRADLCSERTEGGARSTFPTSAATSRLPTGSWAPIMPLCFLRPATSWRLCGLATKTFLFLFTMWLKTDA